MKTLSLILSAVVLSSSCAFAEKPKKEKSAEQEIADEVAMQTKDRWVVILAAYKNFPEAKADGERIAKASKLQFSMRGMIYDKKGLRFPDKFDDPTWAGEYLMRRGNDWWIGDKNIGDHISIEKSSAYPGFAPHLYIVVGSIAATPQQAAKELERFKTFAPQAYVKKTKIYLGCIH